MSPYHCASETTRVGKIPLLRECVVVVVTDPLIAIPGNPLDPSGLVPSGIHVVLGDDVLDFL